ncbi:MAG: tRNA (adenosine(37)-N6)-dimethylallyltransferase MiaA [Gemmatimonadetes bacterium]|nr:tRNA (adenosine(37)-N6)-dimethylallyltransferase MiaA [Gemmatimonadota bacterium]
MIAEELYLVVAGPTAAGKTDVAIAIAQELAGEIVIADSRQVYRGLDIGTAKPTAEQRSAVQHHMIDVVEVGVPYTAADYACDAGRAITKIHERGRTAVVCGGTGFYLAALAGQLDPLNNGSAARDRARVRSRIEGIPSHERHAALAAVDPPTAARLHPHDSQRVERALEVYLLTGEPLSSQAIGGSALRPHVAVWLTRPRAELHQRIKDRLAVMLGLGLEAEAQRFFDAGLSPETAGLDTIGYQEWWPYFAGRTGRTQVVDEIDRATRQYAKRQKTWFRNQGAYEPVPAVIGFESALALWEAAQ